MLLVRLEIIATTYRSTIAKTYVFSLYSHLCIYCTHSISGLAAGGAWVIRCEPEDNDWVNSEIHSEAVIERVWRWTWRPRSSELRDALRGRDRASSAMHLEARIKWTQKYTLRPWSSEFGDALRGCDQASLEMQLETETEWTQKCTGRGWSSEFGDALGGRDRASLEMHLQAIMEGDWRSTWRWSIWRWLMGGVPGAETLFIG